MTHTSPLGHLYHARCKCAYCKFTRREVNRERALKHETERGERYVFRCRIAASGEMKRYVVYADSPSAAVDELYRLLDDGGVVITSLSFFNE